MNDGKIQRLLVLMNAANFTPSEFRSLIQELQLYSVSELNDRYSSVRSAIKRMDIEDREFERSDDFSQVRQDIISFVRRSGLSSSDAVDRLRLRLLQHDKHHRLPEYLPRQGLSRWLDRVFQQMDPTHVLNAAITEFAEHNSGTDSWKLSGA